MLCWQACRIDTRLELHVLSFLFIVARTWHHVDSSKDLTPDLMLYPLARLAGLTTADATHTHGSPYHT